MVFPIVGLYLSAAQAATFNGKVVGIADGDTLTVLTASKKQHKIRLSEIDAPEKHQAFGSKSKQSLSDLCFGKEAEISPRVKGRYQRIVARVKCAGVDVDASRLIAAWPGCIDATQRTMICMYWSMARK